MCQPAQSKPKIKEAVRAVCLACKRGKAKPRQPVSSPKPKVRIQTSQPASQPRPGNSAI